MNTCSTIGALALAAGSIGVLLITGCSAGEEIEPGSAARDEAQVAEEAFQAGRILYVEPQRLASFRLSAGGAVEFYAIPGTDDVGLSVQQPLGGESILPDSEDLSPLDIYLALAPESAPVPRALAAQTTFSLGSRTIAESISEPFLVDTGDRLPETSLTAVGSCTSGQPGADYFRAHYCGDEDGVNSFCDEGAWIFLRRSSDDARKWSRSVTAVCVTTGGVKHFAWNGSAWITSGNTGTISPGKVWIWKIYGDTKFRRIEHQTFHEDLGGFVRGWSEFYN